MKIVLVFGSLFVLANAKNGQGGHHNNHNNHNHQNTVGNNVANPATSAMDTVQCFQALLLSFDFSAPASDAVTQVNSKCTGGVQTIKAFKHKPALKKVYEAYQAMTTDDKNQAKVNQTSNNTAGIIGFFRAKIVAAGVPEKKFNQTIADVYKPLVPTNWKTIVKQLSLSADQKKSLKMNLLQGQDMNAGITFLKAQLDTSTTLQADDRTALTTYVNQLSAISL